MREEEGVHEVPDDEVANRARARPVQGLFVNQRIAELSRPAVRTNRPSGENETDVTSPLCPRSVRSSLPRGLPAPAGLVSVTAVWISESPASLSPGEGSTSNISRRTVRGSQSLAVLSRLPVTSRSPLSEKSTELM